MNFLRLLFAFLSVTSLLVVPTLAHAHEAYVLPSEQVEEGMRDTSINVFTALQDPNNVRISLAVAVGTAIVFLLYFIFQHSAVGRRFDDWLFKLEPWASAMLRIVLGITFYASAWHSSFLGPEIPLSSLAGGDILAFILYGVGTLLILGLFTEIAALIGFLVLVLFTVAYGDYIFTYINYFGEIIALIFFGSRFFSLDQLIFKKTKATEHWKEYEIALIRIAYGISIMYPAITIKLLHPQIIIDIANQYGLTQISWLFPSDPLLISLGAGLAQIAIGICLIIGFQTRLNSLATGTLMVLSIFFFKEAVWPHAVLLGLTAYLIINNGGHLTTDHWFNTVFDKMKKKRMAHARA